MGYSWSLVIAFYADAINVRRAETAKLFVTTIDLWWKIYAESHWLSETHKYTTTTNDHLIAVDQSEVAIRKSYYACDVTQLGSPVLHMEFGTEIKQAEDLQRFGMFM